ncbi:MAG TPA: histidine kinase [Telluria sp.]
MELSWRSTVSSAADISYLTLLTLLGGLGYIAAAPSIPVIYFIAVLCMFELTLMVWAIVSTSGKNNLSAALAYVWKIQANAAAQVALNVIISAATGLAALYVLNSIDPVPEITARFTAANLLLLLSVAVPACLVTALVISAWRLHAIRKSGFAFSDLNAGALNSLEFRLPAPEGMVRDRLEHHLTALTADRAPGLLRLYYGKKPTITRKSAEGRIVFEVVWAWCPTKICIAVVPDGAFATKVRATCELRSRYWKAELMVNPIDAIALRVHLQTNVFQLLSSDMALSASAVKHDKLRNQALEMQLRILQAQIEPHFLFNTLASVRHLYRSSTDAGELMMDHVITYLRCTMQELRSDESTVGREMDLVLHYLAIMKIRMGERLSYSFIHSDDVAARPFPPAMLISLVENAIKHGLNDKADGKLTISAAREEQHLRVTVLDNGAGFSSVQGTGVGLSNIRQRLEAIYGAGAWLEVGAVASGGFMASIIIPVPESA